MLGTLLNVKPLISVREGQIVPLERVRTRGKAFERLGQLMAQMGSLDAVALVQSDEQAGVQLEAVVRPAWSGPIERFFLGPVVGTHAGPGVAGIVAISSDG
jgi:fatty acid-binding protein DegV